MELFHGDIYVLGQAWTTSSFVPVSPISTCSSVLHCRPVVVRMWSTASHSFAIFRFCGSGLPHNPSRQHSNSLYGEVWEHCTTFSWFQVGERISPCWVWPDCPSSFAWSCALDLSRWSFCVYINTQIYHFLLTPRHWPIILDTNLLGLMPPASPAKDH